MQIQYGDNDFIKLYRKMLNWEWYTDVNTKVLFLHCLLRANWKPGEWKGIHYDRGQFITSIHSLAIETGLTDKMVRVALEHLILSGELASERQSKGSVQGRIITVLNYDEYQSQGKPTASETADEGQGKGKARASEGQQYKNIKNIKEIKEEKKDIYTSSIDDIFSYLNLRTGKKFTGRSKAQKQHIIARLKEGYTVEEFKQVIDNKVAAWGHSEKMAMYLRPETLFGTKFETYLNDVETERQKARREDHELHEKQVEAIRAAADFDVAFLK